MVQAREVDRRFPDVGRAGKSGDPARIALQRARVPADQESPAAQRDNPCVGRVAGAWELTPFADADRPAVEVSGDLVKRGPLAYRRSAQVLASDHEQALSVIESHRPVEPHAVERLGTFEPGKRRT